jgi:hypothetical protein
MGIDISPTACRVMAKRLRDVCTCRKANALARRTVSRITVSVNAKVLSSGERI